jgi:hypothetical protein
MTTTTRRRGYHEAKAASAVDEIPVPPDAAEASISEGVWNEFEALLAGDEATMNASKDAFGGVDEGMTATAATTAAAAAEETTTPTTTMDDASKRRRAKKKKEGKKRRRKEEEEEEEGERDYESSSSPADNQDVEQASYEARLARLILLRKRHRRGRGGDTNECHDGLDSSGVDASVFYESGLAFRHEEYDDDDDGDDDGEDDAHGRGAGQGRMTTASTVGATTSNDDGGGRRRPGTTMATTTSSPCVPTASPSRTSLADILRGRRDAARKMSSRGGGGDDYDDDDNINDDNRANDDGSADRTSWF